MRKNTQPMTCVMKNTTDTSFNNRSRFLRQLPSTSLGVGLLARVLLSLGAEPLGGPLEERRSEFLLVLELFEALSLLRNHAFVTSA